MRIKILCWNVRGLNDSEKRKLIKGVVRNQKPDLVCLLETKVKEMSLQMVKSVGGRKRGVLHLCLFYKLH